MLTRSTYIRRLCSHVCVHVGLMFMYIQALDEFGEQLDLVHGIFTHEIIHALGFSSRLFNELVAMQYVTILSDHMLKICRY